MEKRIPRRRFKEFVGSGEWEEKKLGEISDVRDGTHDSPKFTLKGYPLVTSKNVRHGYINYDDVKYISKKDYESINKRSKVDKNDILMGMIGTIGNIALIRKIPKFAIKNVALIKDINKVNYLYLYYNIQCPAVKLQIFEGVDGGTQKFISLNKIRKLNIPIPSLGEQEKIGHFFQKLDRLIDINKQKLGKLKASKSAYLTEMFPGEGEDRPRRRFQGFTGEWEEKKLGEVVTTITDYVAAGSFADIAKNVTYLNKLDYAQLIRTIDIKHKFKNSSFVYVDKTGFEFLWRVNLNKESIILPNIGANIGEIYHLLPSDLLNDRNVLGPNAILLRSVQNMNFLFNLFNTIKFQNQLNLIIASSGQPKFNKTELKQINISIPSLSEQEKIGNFFKKLDQQIEVQEEKLEKLEKMKKAYLAEMFV